MKIVNYGFLLAMIVSLFTACEKDERPAFSTSKPVIASENNTQYVGADKTILVGDTFQVSFTVTPGTGNILDEIIIERIVRDIKTNVLPDSQPHGTSWRYIDEFIADSVSSEETFRFTFIDTRENQYTKIIKIKTATILKDSFEVVLYTSAARNSYTLLNTTGYPMGYDLVNGIETNYTPTGMADSSIADIVSFEAGGTFNGGFQSLNGRLFAKGPATWRIDSITDRDAETAYNTQLANNTLVSQVAKTEVGEYYVTKIPGNVNFVVFKITQIDADYKPLCNLSNQNNCSRGALSFKTIQKINP